MSSNRKYNVRASKPVPETAQKQVNIGRGFTAIDFAWVNQELSVEFGDIGTGWGLKNVHYEMHGNNVVCLADFWYQPDDDTVATFPTVGDAQVIKGNIAEAYKKAQTNAVSKAALYLGIGLSCFVGKFIDDPYLDRAASDDSMFNEVPVPTPPTNGTKQAPKVNPSSLEHIVERITHNTLEELYKTPIVGKTSKGVLSYMAQRCPTLGALFKPGAKNPVGQLTDYLAKYHGAKMEGPVFVLICVQLVKERYGSAEAFPIANIYKETFGQSCPIPLKLPLQNPVALALDEVPYEN